MKSHSAAPVIESTTLTIMVYGSDRTTAIGRAKLTLLIDPICGCVLREALSTSSKPEDVLIEAFSSWQASKLTSGKSEVVLRFGSALRSTAVTNAARSAGYQIQNRNRLYTGTVERAVANLTRGCEMKSGLRPNKNSKVTVAEMQQIVSISAAVNNQQKWNRTDINQAKNAFKPAGTGIPLEVRRLYSSVQESSLEHGFDIEQVNLIWRAASLAYSVKDISSMFEVTLEKFTSTITYHDHLRRAFRSPSPASVQPAEILEGKGAVAIRTLAHLKVKRDRQAFIWTPGMDWNYTVESWVDFTYALLEKLVKDGLVPDTLRCKLFARDLGL
ncbi:hypothetical protein [Pseudomonas sp. PS01303]|uniref:hypothetical protein n=1 Tax=Pseudomonas sp. PS01303 TaxID=2991439 RepID=UPI00249B6513|nr:hypothetical protein [Pseudomonas sp. PS01303]